ncbi:MAG: 4,5-dioxygenase [Gammaproteobacteria bacterium]|nr:4,5-dioxygenase [Gammaproteobacteria bacterium]|tara:strand:- start:7768 stop:8100 length:333 start_codon:yes stop_codon:yes gene_type:complete
MEPIADFHAHVYFSHETLDQATTLCEQARDRFGIPMGRLHCKPVGPHPMWSCQLTVPTEQFGEVIAWLSLNRDGLTLFIHPNTGDAYKDHTDHALWMGQILPLGVRMFKK